jgi:3',5'-cyclic AMP phosphodiesterase CpdA
MKRIIHLSDLHFGSINVDTLLPLQQIVKKIGPDLIIISGDLTHNAKREEYEQAQKFIHSLPRPRLIIPGNHDIPLYNVLDRLFRPVLLTENILQKIYSQLTRTKSCMSLG